VTETVVEFARAEDAQAACNALKKSGFGCFATRN